MSGRTQTPTDGIADGPIRIGDLFCHRDKDGALSEQLFKHVIDALATAFGVPCRFAAFLPQGAASIEFSCYQTLVAQKLRGVQKFSDWEDSLIANASERLKNSERGVRFAEDYFFRDRMGSRFAILLRGLDCRRALLSVGPIHLIADDSRHNDFEIDAKNIVIDDEPSKSLDKLWRDVNSLVDCIEDFLKGETFTPTLTANDLEEIARAIAFAHLSPDEVSDGGLRAALKDEIGFRKLGSAFEVLLERAKHTGNHRDAAKFSLKVQPTGQLEQHVSTDRWANFLDRYALRRNLHCLRVQENLRSELLTHLLETPIERDFSPNHSKEIFEPFAKKLREFANADECVIYRYRAGELPETRTGLPSPIYGYLEQVGASFANPGLQEASLREAESMTQAGSIADKRGNSICYRAVDSSQTQFHPNARGIKLSVVAIRQPSSVCAVPILMHGHVWGVLEMYGAGYGRFHLQAMTWIEAIASIFASSVYDHWMLSRFREVTRAVMIDGTPQQKYEAVLEHIRSLFLADSARLFRQHNYRTGEYHKEAHAGIPWPENIYEKIDLNSEASPTAKCIREKCAWKAVDLIKGEFRDGKDGEPGPFEQLGQKAAAIIPIRDVRGDCYASIYLTTPVPFPVGFGPDWDNSVKTISGQLRIVIETIQRQARDIEARVEYMAHTIKTRVKRLADGLGSISSALKPVFGERDQYKNLPQFVSEIEAMDSSARLRGAGGLSWNSKEVLKGFVDMVRSSASGRPLRQLDLPVMLGDMMLHLEEVRKSSSFIAGGPNEDDPNGANPVNWKGTPADIRLSILASIMPRNRGILSAHPLPSPDTSVLPANTYARIPERVLIEIVNNILDNAIAYDFVPPSVWLGVFSREDHRRRRVIELCVKNLAPTVDVEEAAKLRVGGFRGSYARRKQHDGNGIGLRYCIEKALEWNLDFSYEPAQFAVRSIEGASFGYHVAILTVPVWSR